VISHGLALEILVDSGNLFRVTENERRKMPLTKFTPSTWLSGLVAEMSRLQIHELEPAERQHIKLVFADTVAAIAAGSGQAENARYASRFSSEPWAGAAMVIGAASRWASAEDAAFANATSGVALELDEGIRPTGHPAVHVVPAALAMAQSTGAQGDALLDAFVFGYEVAARLYAGFAPHPQLHPHGSFGAIGAAVAAARLIEADPVIAASLAASAPLAPMWPACLDGATVRNTYAGGAASLGVRSAWMAAAGFTASPSAVDVAFGSVLGHLDQERSDERPGSLRICSNYFKLHSACAHLQSAIDACVELAVVDPADLLSVRVRVPPVTMRLSEPPRLNPLSIRFSLPYVVTVALLTGRCDENVIVPDASYLEIAERVEVEADDRMGARWPEECPARVIVGTTAGVQEREVSNHRGHHLNPAAPAELRDKFERLTRTSSAAGSFERLAKLEEVPDASVLFS
jgi:2-methylcitrate dehydratase PrpD